MLEYPEITIISKQLNESIHGRKILTVLPPSKPHKFCWFNGDPSEYNKMLTGSSVIETKGFGLFVEITFSNGKKLCFNDGVHPSFFTNTDKTKTPENYQLMIIFEDNSILVFTVAMYGGLFLHNGDYDNEYYLKSLASFSPDSDDFTKSFKDQISTCKPSMSAKAFLATDQHFPGIGNGVIQDILFDAAINPRTKISLLSDEQKEQLLKSTKLILSKMVSLGGRDTETDIFGNKGGYITKMSKNAIGFPCSVCGSNIIKEAYLGGSVYYCPKCQKCIK